MPLLRTLHSQSCLAATCAAAVTLGACSVPDYHVSTEQNVGGQTELGGTATSGGATTNGGVHSGGASSSSNGGNAGSLASGGVAGTTTDGVGGNYGGVSSNGGASAGGDTSLGVGGASLSSMGGNSSSGGFVATGGSLATGGAFPTGGNPSTGGAPTGGLSRTESMPATGGAPPTGGTVSTGGVAPTGGTVSTGGAIASGGTTAALCAAGYAFCDNIESYTVGSNATAFTPGAGTWSVTTDTTQTAGDQQVYSNKSVSNSTSQAGTSTFTNATIEASLKVTSFSSDSASNAAGVYLRNNGTNDYDLALGADGILYLRRSMTTSTVHACTTGNASAASGLTITTTGCTSGYCTAGWFKLKLVVAGTITAGITIAAYIDPTGASGYTQAFQCIQNAGVAYIVGSGSAGVFSKGSAQAEYDDVLISVQ